MDGVHDRPTRVTVVKKKVEVEVVVVLLVSQYTKVLGFLLGTAASISSITGCFELIIGLIWSCSWSVS